MKFQEACPVLSVRRDGPYAWIEIGTDRMARETAPGQFVNVRADHSFEPLLRRPFSVCDTAGQTLTLLILVRGPGTEKIAGKKPGDTLDVIGPLGKGFPAPGRKTLFVAGGIGIAPFLLMSRSVGNATLLFGAKNSSFVPDLVKFRERMTVLTATEDGSAGEKGTVIDLLARYDLSEHTVLACGPNPMLRAVGKLLSHCPDADAYFSVETIMGCGFGACKGCAVNTPSGDYKLACKDGPVFRWNEISL